MYSADAELLHAEARPGRPSEFLLRDEMSKLAEAVLVRARGRSVTWHSNTKERLKARFAAARVHCDAEARLRTTGDFQAKRR